MRSRQSIGPSRRNIGWRLDEPTLEALVVAFGVVVGDVLSDGCAEVVLAQQRELIEALVGVQARRAEPIVV